MINSLNIGLNIDLESTVNRDFFHILAEFGLSADDIDKGFLAAGGSSLIAISLVARLKRIGFHDLSVECLLSTTMLQDILASRTENNQPNSDVFFESNQDYHVIPLEQVNKDETPRIITKSFVEFAELDVLVHHNCDELKLQCEQDWLIIINQRWEHHLASNLSFGITLNNGYLIGIALSNDFTQEPPMDFTSVTLLNPIFDMIESAENQFIEDLHTAKTFPERVLHNFLTAVNPDLQADERLKVMFHLEREVLQIAASKQFQAVITANASSATKQLAEHVFRYDISRVVYANQYRNSSGMLVFPNAESKLAVAIDMKYIV